MLGRDMTVQGNTGVSHKAKGVYRQDAVADETWGLHISRLGFW